jgi:GNAT superfamily N-acetyltransferase
MTEIRVATALDLTGLVGLRTSSTAERRDIGPDPAFAERFRAWFDAEAHQRTFWVAIAGGDAVGMTNLLTFERMPGPGIDAGRWGYLGNMYVRPEHRNRGVGRLLLDALIAHADAHGLERIVLSPSERSRPFYGRAGFDSADTLLLRPRP